MDRDGNAECSTTHQNPPGTLNSRRKPTLSKACVPCHNSKSRCDSPVVGIPCTRCADKGCSDSCTRTERKQRRRNTAVVSVAASPINKQQSQTAAPSRPGGASCSQAQAGRTSFRGDASATLASPSPIQHDASSLEEPEGTSAEIQICREMLNDKPVSRSVWPVSPASREVVQYHHSQHYLTILGEALGKDKRRRLTRIVLDGMRPRTGRPPLVGRGGFPDPLAGLDDVDRDYLLKKRVLDVPPRECAELIFKSYFEYVYPYAPIMDRVEFLRDYYANHYSVFMVQAVLASGSMYVPMSTIHSCGFTSRSEAQASFFAKATLLYDFGCERRQLRMLQGSAILGSTPCAHEMDKEFRYWFYNAVRLAVKMGLHQCDLAEEMDASSYRLCKRIWWYLLGRDVLFSFVGVQNMRLIGADSSNICPLTLADYEADDIPPEFSHILSPASLSQRVCFIENGRLAMAAASCLSMVQDESKSQFFEEDFHPFAAWRTSLFERLSVACNPSMTGDVSITVSVAQSYRLECIIFRLLRSRLQRHSLERCQLAKQQLRGAMFELDTIIGRATMQGMLNRFPLSFITTIPSLLALHIEISVDELEPDVVRALSRTYIRHNLVLLRLMSDFPIIRRTIPVFEWVLQQKGICVGDAGPVVNNTTSPQPPSEAAMGSSDAHDSMEDLKHAMAAPESSLTGSPQDPAGWFDDFLRPDYLDNLYLTSFL